MCCLSSCSYIKPQRSPKGIRGGMELFIILFLHQTTTAAFGSSSDVELFIILFLHQTTTLLPFWMISSPLFIILFLHQTTTESLTPRNLQRLFIILFLHQTTTRIEKLPKSFGCLSSCSYIKPQLLLNKTTGISRCLSSCSYIKPQPEQPRRSSRAVVYHLVPTSNHNLLASTLIWL